MRKRILAILLTIAMCISILPMMTLADALGSKVAYAVLDGKKLTFYYGEEKPEGAYDVPNLSSDEYRSDIPWYEQRNDIEEVVFDKSFKDYKPTSTRYWFYEFKKLTTIENLDYLDTSCVTDMSYMFYYCCSVTSLDVSNWDTSSVTDMTWMFGNCKNLTALDVSKLDTSSVKKMSTMFYGCGELETLDVSGWDTSGVTDMSAVFGNCVNLTTLDVSNWDTSSVTDMSGMFSSCTNLTALKISDWDTSSVKNMSTMFFACTNLMSLDLSCWDTSSVTDMFWMFHGCLNLSTLDISKWDTSAVKHMEGAFDYCSSLTNLDVSKWNTSSVQTMKDMFRNCSNLKSLDLSGWDTSSVEEMSHMFDKCSNLTMLDLSSFDTSGLVWGDFSIKTSHKSYSYYSYGIESMFANCSNLKTVYVSDKWQLSDVVVTNSLEVFTDCTNLVGEKGTSYNSEHVDADYAHIDGGESNPGYLTLKMCTVDFKGGEGATGTVPTPICLDIGSELEIPSASSLSKSGYKFAGWSDGNSVYAAGDKYKLSNKDVTFTAQWECLHEHTEIKNAKKATTSAEGYTGDTYCTVCGEKVKSGEAIPSLTPEPTTSPTPNGGNSNPTTAPTPTKDPNLDVGDFVDRCYDVALGREADEAGYDSWKSQLNNGQACGAQVGYGFIFSPEYILKDTSNEQFVKDLYTMFFDREPDEGGFNYWVGMLNDGTAGREQVFAGFANSVEFYNLCLKYGVVAGYYVVGVNNEQQGGVNSFVARLYKVCLNRMPDQGGQAGWVIKLMNGEVTGTTCAYGFVFSPEFVGKEPTNVEFVNYMYAAFFGRAADDDGLNYWVSQLDGGTASREDIFSGFAGSIEFDALCKSYGISV